MYENKTERLSYDNSYDIYLSLNYTNDEFIDNKINQMN